MKRHLNSSSRKTLIALIVATLGLALMSTIARATGEPSPAETAAHDAYIQWLQSGAETGKAAISSAEKFAAYQKAVAGWRAKLEQDRAKEPLDPTKRANLTETISQLDYELCPPLDAKTLAPALAYALDGLWEQAGEKAAQATTGRTMLDEIIAGYSALADNRWVDASNFFRKVDRAPLKGWLLKSVGSIAEAHPNNPEAQVLMADALLRAGLTQRCRAYMHSAGVRESVGQSSFGGTVNTVALIRFGDFEGAKSLFNGNSTFEKDDPRRSFFLGVVTLLEKPFNEDQAVPFFQRAIDLDKEFLPARVALAAALVNMGRADEAKSLFSECGDAIASYDPARINLAAAGNWLPPSGGSGEKGLLGAVRGWADAKEFYEASPGRRLEIVNTWSIDRLSNMRDGLEHNHKHANGVHQWLGETSISFNQKIGVTSIDPGSISVSTPLNTPNGRRADLNRYDDAFKALPNITSHRSGEKGVTVAPGTPTDSNSPILPMGDPDRDRVELAKAKTPILDLMITTGGE